jgi:hypothetical protein
MKYRILIAAFVISFFSFPAGADTFKWKEQKSEHFLIYYNGANDDFVEEVRNAAEEYYRKISDDLNVRRFKSWTWDDRAKIYIYDDQDSYVSEGQQMGWSHGVANTRQKIIRTFPAAHGFFDSTLPHELTHIIFRELIGYKVIIPTWFEEGVAMYHEQARRWGAHEVVRKSINDGTFIPLQDLSNMRLGSGTDPDKINLFYAEAASAVNYLIQEGGEQKFLRFCEKLSSGGEQFEWALQAVYIRYRSLEKLNKDWMEFLKNG